MKEYNTAEEYLEDLGAAIEKQTGETEIPIKEYANKIKEMTVGNVSIKITVD